MKKRSQKKAVRVVLTASVTVISSATLSAKVNAAEVPSMDKWAAIQTAYRDGQIAYLESGKLIKRSVSETFRNTASPWGNSM